ncbi:MAG: DUF2264 domain-containing protein [Planctomycetota bacterium]
MSPESNRRRFLSRLAAGCAAGAAMTGGKRLASAADAASMAEESTGFTGEGAAATDRAAWVGWLTRVARPVLENLAAGSLRATMPVECAPGLLSDRSKCTHLEAIGRTMVGITPWLELGADDSAEGQKRAQFIAWTREGLARAVDPASPDYIDFTASRQCLVDAAFLAQGFLRAPQQVWSPLPEVAKQRMIAAMQSTRKHKPGQNNWLLFSAMVEAFLASIGESWEAEPVDYALQKHEEWYKGDGIYGDGADFHWDYYNSYVIQPFLVDALAVFAPKGEAYAAMVDPVEVRAERYAAIQERLIAPDGSFPPLGRSICYRCGAFHLLAQAALRERLPEGVSPAQVRCALGTVIGRLLGAPGTFDNGGWLQIGFCGHQPQLGERYISTGSLYLCSVAFLPLGLKADHEYWAAEDAPWTSKRIYAGEDLPADHAIKTPRSRSSAAGKSDSKKD